MVGGPELASTPKLGRGAAMNHVGRVFFQYHPSDTNTLEWVAFQPLENHRANVEKLLRAWQMTDNADWGLHPSTRPWLLEAVAQHDWGKRSTFSIIKPSKKAELSYSFAGHRFRLHPSITHPYAKLIERGHHDFSTKEIATATYQLLHRDRLTLPEPQRFAKDLYIYEMCDQIEAELSNWVWANHSDNRPFMSFALNPLPNNPTNDPNARPYAPSGSRYHLNPFPLMQPLELVLEFHLHAVGKKVSEALAHEIQQLASVPGQVHTVVVKLEPLHAPQETSLTWQTPEQFYQSAANLVPNVMQREVWHRLMQGDDAVLLKAPTGSGKTEAASLPLLCQNKWVVVVLPSKALIDDHVRRFSHILTRLSQGHIRRLIIDTGDQSQLLEFRGGKCVSNQNLARHLYKADVILTTLDKLLYRYFGYAEKRKSYTFPLRLGEAHTAFVFDEAHSYDGTAFSNFMRLLEALYLRNHSLVVMTATLPNSFANAPKPEFNLANAFSNLDYLQGEAAQQLLEQQLSSGQKGPHLGQRKLVCLPEVNPALPQETNAPVDATVRKELFEQHKHARRQTLLQHIQQLWENPCKILVTVDRVKDAAWLYGALRQNPLPNLSNGDPTKNLLLYHGRLDPAQRSQVFARVKELDINNTPYVLIATSAIEVGVDLDADHLLTEICTPEALIQRAGRVNRHGRSSSAHIWVLGQAIPEYLNTLPSSASANYLQSLSELSMLDGTASQQLMQLYSKPTLQDPRAEIAFDALAKYVYQSQIEYQPLHDLGFIATRSWEPTLTVAIEQDDAHYTIKVPIGQLSGGTADAAKVRLEVLVYPDERSTQPQWLAVSYGGDLYQNDYRVVLDGELAAAFDREVGFVELPKVFQRERWSSDPPLKVRLRTYRLDNTVDTESVFFLADERAAKTGKSIYLSYLSEPGLVEA